MATGHSRPRPKRGRELSWSNLPRRHRRHDSDRPRSQPLCPGETPPSSPVAAIYTSLSLSHLPQAEHITAAQIHTYRIQPNPAFACAIAARSSEFAAISSPAVVLSVRKGSAVCTCGVSGSSFDLWSVRFVFLARG